MDMDAGDGGTLVDLDGSVDGPFHHDAGTDADIS
jgi:hypothetical protein